MTQYIVNKRAQNTGEHEVHTKTCSWFNDIEDYKYLGSFDNCRDAIKEAKKYYNNVDGCKHCCPDCHTK